MNQTNNFGMNHFQNVNNNMNQINNDNGLNNPMLNQYNQINPMLYPMNTMLNQNNPMLNQINTFNQNNPMLNQMNTFNQNILMMNQTSNYNQGNPILSQMNTMLNQMDIILNQMNIMLNQMNSYEQNNLVINIMNQVMNEINQKMLEMNQKINQINQMELINSIIQFYKENGNEYMNFENPYQIKNIIYFLSLNYHKLDKSDNIEDPLDYIEEPKKIIRFINSDYKEYKVKIPLSITKYDLYSIAQNYKCFKNNNKHLSGNQSNILLIHNNLILNRDETSIECINENDIIIIIEPRNFPDDSYYKSLQERTENKGNIKFSFSFPTCKVIIRVFPDDIKVYEIYKSYNLEFGLDINTYRLLFNAFPLKINDQKYGSYMFNHDIIIHEFNPNVCFIFGKIVNATIKNNKETGSSASFRIGILNSVKLLIEEYQKINPQKKLKKLTIGNKVVKKNDTMSLFSLGIKNNFTCFAENED